VKMWVYLVRRLFLLVVIIVGVMTITFALVEEVPIQDRLASYLGPPPKGVPGGYSPTLFPGEGVCPANATSDCPNPYYYYAINRLGLNEPVYEQWATWMYDSFTGNWGYVSNHSDAAAAFPAADGQPVVTVLGWFLPYSLELGTVALLCLFASIPLGMWAASHRNRAGDQGIRVLSFSGLAMPDFLLGSVILLGVIIWFGSLNHWQSYGCPGQGTYFDLYGSWPPQYCFSHPDPTNLGYPSWLIGGYLSTPTGFPTIDAVIHGQYELAADTVFRMLLPAIIVAYDSIGFLLRFVRNSMLEVMNLDFVRTARATGVPETTVLKRHAGRNSWNVTLTVLGLTIAGFWAGFPVIETIFGLHGVGYILAVSVAQPIDFGLTFGSTILFTIIIVVANLVVDILYAYLDPRVRLG
jgi:ABC-type dipeptide/oligopeptide/nickel transport system permease component